MKKKLLFSVAIILSVILSSWIWGDFTNYSQYSPILMTREQLNNSVHIESPRQLCQTGKIYYKDGYIFVNELYRGIHVIDNHDPANPEPVCFVVVPGCIDVAIKNDVLYADNAVDLIALKLNDDFTQVTVTQRIKNVFPEMTPPDGLPVKYDANRPENTVIVGWEKL